MTGGRRKTDIYELLSKFAKIPDGDGRIISNKSFHCGEGKYALSVVVTIFLIQKQQDHHKSNLLLLLFRWKQRRNQVLR